MLAFRRDAYSHKLKEVFVVTILLSCTLNFTQSTSREVNIIFHEIVHIIF